MPLASSSAKTTATTAAAMTRTSRQPGTRASSGTIRLGGDPDRRDQDAARNAAPPPRQETLLGPVESHRDVGADDRVGELAGGEVARGRRVHGKHRHARGPRPVAQLHGGPDRLAKLAPHAGPEERVDHERGALLGTG